MNTPAAHRFINQHNSTYPNEPARTILDACEGYYMNGFYDDIGGDVDTAVGHYYRIERFIVRTDTQGFRECDEFHTIAIAKKAFAELETEYNKYDETD